MPHLYCLSWETEPEPGFALQKTRRCGWVGRVPAVLVSLVEIPQDLLGSLGGEVFDPVDLSPHLGQVLRLVLRPERPLCIPPGDLSLLQSKVVDGSSGMAPLANPLRLLRGRLELVGATDVRLLASRRGLPPFRHTNKCTITGQWAKSTRCEPDDTACLRCTSRWRS